MDASCEGKTCTCGIGPWSAKGKCDHCGGFDLGVPGLIHVNVTEEEIRRICREEIVDLVRRTTNAAARTLLPHV